MKLHSNKPLFLSSNPHHPKAVTIRRPTSAFTIVELLIVIVIIGILAAITVVAYNGITGRARVAALQSAATQAATKIELLKDSNGNYPTTVSSTDLPPPPNITYDYQPVASKGTYCLTATDPATGSYFVTSTGTKSVGPCPVAYFPLDGTAEDKSAYQNNGTNNGATATADRNGKANGAMGFDGVDDVIRLQNVYDTIIYPGQETAKWTLSLWAKPSTGTNSIIFGRQGYNAGIHFSPSISYGFYLWNNTANAWTLTSSAVSTAEWQHVTAVYDNRQMTLYVNGNNAGTRAFTDSLWSTYATRQPTIGAGISSYFFNGLIDDARAYTKALSDKEIKQLYNAS